MSEQYEIRIRGLLDPDWVEWFDGMIIKYRGGDETVMRGRVRDQAALFGMLTKLRSLGLELVQVRRIPPKGNKKTLC
jgi:hypothetical protein